MAWAVLAAAVLAQAQPPAAPPGPPPTEAGAPPEVSASPPPELKREPVSGSAEPAAAAGVTPYAPDFFAGYRPTPRWTW